MRTFIQKVMDYTDALPVGQKVLFQRDQKTGREVNALRAGVQFANKNAQPRPTVSHPSWSFIYNSVPFGMNFEQTLGHLLRLARIGPHEQHSAVAKPDMGDLQGHRHAAQQHNLVAPVELVGLSRSKAQRPKGCSRRLSAFLGPALRVAAHRIIATLNPHPRNSSNNRISVRRSRSGFASFSDRS
jgi:hypothetical protein